MTGGPERRHTAIDICACQEGYFAILCITRGVHSAAPAPIWTTGADLPCRGLRERLRHTTGRAVFLKYPFRGSIRIVSAAEARRVHGGVAVFGRWVAGRYVGAVRRRRVRQVCDVFRIACRFLRAKIYCTYMMRKNITIFLPLFLLVLRSYLFVSCKHTC